MPDTQPLTADMRTNIKLRYRNSIEARRIATRRFPDAAGQVLADPTSRTSPHRAARISRSGSRHVRLSHSNRAVGLRVLAPGAIRAA